MTRTISIPCTMMRGGTSRGLYFLADDLPADRRLLARILSVAMGSGSAHQVDGVGGGTSLTSKAAIVSRSAHPDADIDFFFAQISVNDTGVDFEPSCGNIVTGVGPFAIEAGLVEALHGETPVRIHSVNTGAFVEAVVQTPGGRVTYEGDTSIDGVAEPAAPVRLNFLDAVGSKTGKMLPTGNLRDQIDGIAVSCLDVAVPIVLISASELGLEGTESKDRLDNDRHLLERLEQLRRAASLAMGLGDATGKVIPKLALLSRPRHGGTITSRYFVPENCHTSHAVTGALGVATSTLLAGTLGAALANRPDRAGAPIRIEHPSGTLELALEATNTDAGLEVRRAGLIRTARKLFSGELYIPAHLWPTKML